MCKKLLEALGCSVETAGDGEEAVSRIEREKFDLVFMDCAMPNMNGYDATREIRLREREGQHMVVVALSASVLPEERARCRDAGMDDFVAKPYTAEDLQNALTRWVGPGRAAEAAKTST
jgi:CheY-like chemotaxis protein